MRWGSSPPHAGHWFGKADEVQRPAQVVGEGDDAPFSAHFGEAFDQEVVESTPRHAFGGVLTYPTQFLTYSFAQGRWSFPPIMRACKAEINAAQLCSQIDYLQRVQKRLRLANEESQ